MILFLEEKYYDIFEITQTLKLSDSTVRKYIKEQKLKAHKIGKSWYVKEQDIQFFITNSNNIK